MHAKGNTAAPDRFVAAGKRLSRDVSEPRALDLVGLRVQMVKKGETWLVTDAESQEPVRAGR